ncbi:MAG: hypothetical protein CBC78_000810 [Candidatus Pelagibacter sp. TMED118]|nr:MAG: hypothetical protein CBC78_000810 [Candidatus Pelagibacter sp. TMED118]|tara:strand:+ start:7604 stop:8422 length:819 start_codon:yes stop_codon:yes gene_type:complete
MINKIGIMQGRLVPREIKSKLQSFPFKNWKKEFNIAAKNGIKIIEWTIDYNTFKRNPIIKNYKSVKKICLKKKIKIQSVTADFFMQKPCFKNFNKKNYTLNYLKILLESCKRLKIRYIILPLVDQSSIKHLYEEKKLVSQLLHFRKINKLGSIKLLFETDYHPLKIKPFLKKFGKGFGINYDTGNSSSLNYKFKDEKKYFNKVYNIHIKDRKKNGVSVRLGQGDFKIKEFLEHIKLINYTGNLILQTYIPNNSNVPKETIFNYNYLKKNINL